MILADTTGYYPDQFFGGTLACHQGDSTLFSGATITLQTIDTLALQGTGIRMVANVFQGVFTGTVGIPTGSDTATTMHGHLSYFGLYPTLGRVDTTAGPWSAVRAPAP
jgi:hypothetical protein